MSRIIKSIPFQSTSEDTEINFEHYSVPGAWGEKRYLTINGKRAYELSFPCDTCYFVFRRMNGANQAISIDALGNLLREGITTLDQDFLETIGSILPPGEYLANLLSITPSLVEPYKEGDYFCHEQVDVWGIDSFWGLPHYPQTKYYRSMTKNIGKRRAFFEFVVPMFPENWLNEQTWMDYIKKIDQGNRPTALAVSVFDTKQPANWDGEPPITEHYCLAHFLLDGHHKMYAASKLNRPITLLSFLALGESIALREEIEEIVRLLKS